MRFATSLPALASLILFHGVFAENNPTFPKSSESTPKTLAVYAPKPEYPLEARRRRLVGRGVAILEINRRTGYVKSARMQPSTGHKILDEAALSGFRQWHFWPATVSKVEIPVRYSTKGFSY